MESIYPATVTARTQVTPLMVRLTLALEEGSAWRTTGVGDEFIHIDLGADTLDVDGHSERHYTVSGIVPGGLEVEVFLHGHGAGATWGREAAVGDSVLISDAWDYYQVTPGSGTRVLIGDITALPGIARILADASADEVFRVVIEVPSLDEARELPSAASVDVQWRVAGNGIGPSAVCDIVRGLAAEGVISPEANPYVWIACESKISRAARTLLRREIGMPITQQRIVGYWHANAEQVMADWEALPQETKDAYLAIWREDRTDEENWLELEPFLQSIDA
ncbi:MAG: siderophore-interacting protein [Demequina sp.]|jgi:NADPH-dependent ferric siderophore reductase|nr:siderophore-interacting protein [Demequina sp.]